jgi:ankyrin repeat protein
VVHTLAYRNQDTPLIWASEMGSTDCVKILLDAGADSNKWNAMVGQHSTGQPEMGIRK